MQRRNDNGDVVNESRDILAEIAQKTIKRMEQKKREVPLLALQQEAERLPIDITFPFHAALKRPGMSFICEVKKASPSKGVIAENFPYLAIAKEYEKAGASAISCLTEPFYFKGEDRFLKKIAREVSIPVLRKDFTVDRYMIYEAKVLGASAVLLICAILDDVQLKSYLLTAHKLGLSALVETHSAQEVMRALKIGARIIGVNNRDLKTFTVDITTSCQLKKLVPPDVIFVSESGIQTKYDILKLHECGADAVLVGETLMRASDKKAALSDLASLL